MKILITILAYYIPRECKSNTRNKFLEDLLEISLNCMRREWTDIEDVDMQRYKLESSEKMSRRFKALMVNNNSVCLLSTLQNTKLTPFYHYGISSGVLDWHWLSQYMYTAW